VVSLFTESAQTATVGFHVKGVTAWQYAVSQPGVVLHYLRLAVWPDGLCLDYGWPIAQTTAEVLLPAVLLALLLAAGLWAARRWPGVGFCSLAFFIVLAPTSSVVPLKDLAFEHRMYLPLAPLTVLAVLAADAALAGGSCRARLRTLAAAAVVLGLSTCLARLTVHRNAVYRTRLVMWADVVAKRPNNARGYTNLGKAVKQAGDLDKAFVLYSQAIRLAPDYATAHWNMGNTLFQLDKMPQAVHHFQKVLSLDPSYPLGHYNLANALFRAGRPEEAVGHYREAVRINPNYAPAHGNLAGVLLSQGKAEEAAEHYRQAVRLAPHLAPVQNNLGAALLQLAAWPQAADAFAQAVRLAPEQAEYRRNLAFALHKQGRLQAAQAEYQASLRLDPRWPRAALQEAWELATHPDAARRDGRSAVLQAEQVLQAEGDRAVVLDVLAAALAEAAQFDQAVAAAQRAMRQARQAGQGALAQDVQTRLTLYQKRQPYRANRR
jgi:tetratricopeptide (TPR) repeat protein